MTESVHTAGSVHSLRERLAGYIGRFLTAGVLLGLTRLETREGILCEVGPDWFLLRDPDSGAETLCELASLKYITVCPSGMRPCFPAALPAPEQPPLVTTPRDGGALFETTGDGLYRRLERDARFAPLGA